MKLGHLKSKMLPILFGIALLFFWELVVDMRNIPRFLLPAPSDIGQSAFDHWQSLLQASKVTLIITLQAFFWAFVGGLSLAILFTRAQFIEKLLFPYVVILQVTPVVAIAPLIIIWVGFENVNTALIIIAWIVAFFPILTNCVAGLRAIDPNLRDLFKLYGANSYQTLIYLEIPSALPQILTGAKISGGLALIGAVVAEFVAGSGNSTGLAWLIIESGNRLDIASMFASLVLLSLIGISIYYTMTAIEWFALRHWHPSFRTAN